LIYQEKTALFKAKTPTLNLTLNLIRIAVTLIVVTLIALTLSPRHSRPLNLNERRYDKRKS